MFGKIEWTLTKKDIAALVRQTLLSVEDGNLISLPLDVGGIKIRKPTQHSEDCLWSENVVEHLKGEGISEATQKQKQILVEIRLRKNNKWKNTKDKLSERLAEEEHQISNLCWEKAASKRLHVLPLKKHLIWLSQNFETDNTQVTYWNP